MRDLIFAVAACVALTACSTSQLVAERDDQNCRAKGNTVGTASYIDCRAVLEKQRFAEQNRERPVRIHYLPGGPGVPFGAQ